MNVCVDCLCSRSRRLMALEGWLSFCREQQKETNEEMVTLIFKNAARDPMQYDRQLVGTLHRTRRSLEVKKTDVKVAVLAAVAARRLMSNANIGSTIRALDLDADEDDTIGLGLTLLQFQQLLLSQDNRALCPEKTKARVPLEEAEDFTQPMTHYWVACSHNSYLEGDQIASTSSSAMYARLLLQGCRAIEIVRHSGDRTQDRTA